MRSAHSQFDLQHLSYKSGRASNEATVVSVSFLIIILIRETTEETIEETIKETISSLPKSPKAKRLTKRHLCATLLLWQRIFTTLIDKNCTHSFCAGIFTDFDFVGMEFSCEEIEAGSCYRVCGNERARDRQSSSIFRTAGIC